MYQLNKYQVFVDENKCINCKNCVRTCPMVFSITTSLDETNVRITPDRCINCGKCVETCPLKAIDYIDDTETFFDNLSINKNNTIICDPLIKTLFKNYKRLFGYLKQNGINLILSDSIGAKVNKKIANKQKTENIISQDYQKIINYAEKFSPDLIKYLPSILNPAYLTSVYLKQSTQISDSIVYLTNSLSLVNGLKNQNEFFDYFITFTKLENYLTRIGINLNEYPELDFDDFDLETYHESNVHFHIEDFLTKDSINSLVNIKLPSERDFQILYKKLDKNKENQKKINCNCCGYRTCENLTIAMYNHIANENDCVFYLKKRKEIEKQNFENTTRQMKQINDEISGLLNDSMEVAESSERNKIKISTILDNLVDAVIVTDASFSIQSTNMSFETIFGYTEQEVINAPISILFPSHSFLFEENIDGNDEFQRLSFIDSKTEIPIMKKNGSLLQCEIGMNQFELDNENSLVFVIRDISHRSEIEKMKNQFVSTVSHELRTPLTSIKGSLGLLSAGVFGVFPAKANELLAVAEKNCTRLTKLIDDILDLEKINAGKLEFDYENLEINDLVSQSIYLNRPYAEQFGVKITELKLIKTAFIKADKSRLLQVISNLISNAVKFSEPGNEIEIITEKIRDNVKVSIKDNGIGISADSRKKLFDTFSQVDSTDSRAKGGTGLGLSICKLIIENMNGKIDFESTEGKGSTFFFILPEAVESIKTTQ